MSVGFDPSTDFQDVTDGLEAVTLNRRRSSSNVSVAKALQRAVTTSEVEASDGQYIQGDVRWHLPVAEVAVTPRTGDRIVDAAGAYWIVLTVQEATLRARWMCVSRNLAIAIHLDDRVTIEVADFSKGTGGAAERSWSTFRTARAHIQELTADTEDREGARRTARLYDIFLDTDEQLGHQHRVKAADGTLYQVTGSQGVDEVGAFQAVQATEWRQL